MRRASGWTCLGLGLLLLSLSVVDYQSEVSLQHAEQQRRDAHWLKVNQDAARQFPRVLPGEAKPDPAPLQGTSLIVGLAVAGSTALIVGAGLLVTSRRQTPL